ncbi:MAG: VOC family protein [Gammaproteobacteria bacterium]|nr:VOC family protein [Gammaproteobacteria bacterium]
MIGKVHHINFLVRDLDAAVVRWERVLGMPVARYDRLAGRGVVAARFRVGETWIVLVQPTRADSVPGRHLEAHGEGFFLLSLGVDSLDEEIARIGEGSFAGPVRSGAEGWQVRDLQAALLDGAQLQLTEENPA